MGKHGGGTLYKARGKGCWRVRWMFQGKLHDESTGTEDIEKARKIAKQKTACSSALGDVLALRARLEKAKDEQTILEAKMNNSLNLFRMVDAFISLDTIRRSNVSQSTIATWHTYGSQLIKKFGGNREMRSLTKEDAEAFMRDYETKGVSVGRFNAALTFYKRAWRLLARYDSPTELKARLGSESPWTFIDCAKSREVISKRPFTQEQLTRIWRVLEKRKDSELMLLFDLARNTGARLHDIVSWRWDDNISFSLGKGKIEAVVSFKPIKTANSTGKSMTLPILDERVVRTLHDRSKKRDIKEAYVLPKMYALYSAKNAQKITRMVKGVLDEAGLETQRKVGNRNFCIYGLHSFRHTLASELFNKGVDLRTIQYLYTGHGSNFMTELYSHADMDKKREDLSKLAHIETEKKTPDGFQTFIGMLGESDKREYDAIKTMDAPQRVKNDLISLLKYKTIGELEIIRNWLDERIEKAATPKA
jgi:integrase